MHVSIRSTPPGLRSVARHAFVQLFRAVVAAVLLVVATTLIHPPAPADALPNVPYDVEPTNVDACAGDDSYGIASLDSVTLDTTFTCAQTRSSGAMTIGPGLSKVFTSTAPYGYYRQDSTVWRSNTAIALAYSESANPIPRQSVSWTVTGVNTSKATLQMAANVLWTSPAPYISNLLSKSIVSPFWTISATNGASAFLNPKRTRAQLQAVGDASANIFSDDGFIAAFGANGQPNALSETNLNLATYCQNLFTAGPAGAPYFSSLADTPYNCQVVVCNSPRYQPTGLPAWCSAPVAAPTAMAATVFSAVAAPASTDAAGIAEIAEIVEIGGLLEARSSLADPPSLRCPPGTAPLFAEGFVFDYVGEQDFDVTLNLTADGAFIEPVAAMAGYLSGLQLHCNDLTLPLTIDGNVLRGTTGDDDVTSDLDEVLAMLGIGNDRMVAYGRLATVLAGVGDDNLQVHGHGSVARGGPGDDRIEAFGVDQFIQGELGADTLVGSATGRSFINAKDGEGGDTVICRHLLNEVLSDPGDTLVGCGIPAAIPRFTG